MFTITPDEETAAQELGYQTVELKAGEHFNGILPKVSLTPYATKMKLIKVISAKKVNVDTNGITYLSEESLTDVTSQATQNQDGEWTIDYTTPEDGEYTLFVFWQYGTSQTAAPAVSTAFTINYYSKQGSNALINYWDEHVLTPEFKESIQKNGHVQMYMDSLELEPHGEDTTGNLWCEDYLEQFHTRRGYDLSLYLPLLIMEGYARMDNTNYIYELDGNNDTPQKIRNDQYQTNTELYSQNCLEVLADWLHSFDMTLRAENSYGTLLEISQPIAYLDHVETESLEFNGEIESFRSQAGGAHLYDKVYSSETAAVTGGNYWDNNNTYRQLFYTQFASGIQKTMTHGYAAAYGPEEHCSWPGFEGMSDLFGNRFNKRQPASTDYNELWAHINRIQTVLRQGVPQMDLGILRTDYNFECSLIRRGFRSGDQYSEVVKEYANNDMRNQTAYYWKDLTLQNAGYTYDYFSPYLLQDEAITCKNGLVQADGVAYQALLIYQEEMPLDSAKVLLDWAKKGMPLVIVTGSTEERTRYDVTKYNKSAAITTGSLDGKDGELAEVMAQIKAQPTVACVDSEAKAYTALQNMGIQPRAAFAESNQTLLTAMRKSAEATYLYVYNYMYQDTESYQGQISLDGIYTPYCVNTWSGEVDEIGNYSYQDGRTVIDIAIQPGEVMVFALNPYQSSNPVVEKQNVEKVTVKNGNTILYVPQSGKTQITYADNTTYSTEVTVPEDIQLENWNLTVESWTPGDKVTRTEDKGYGYITTEATYHTQKTNIEVGTTELLPWSKLEQVGETVSGVGNYTNTFYLPEDWDNDKQAIEFRADSFNGGTAAVWINGTQVPIDMNTGKADLSGYVTAGDNTIQVRVTSSLRNIMLELGYAEKGNWKLLGENALYPDEYGMVGNTFLKLYTKVASQDIDHPISSDVSENSPPIHDNVNSPQTGDIALTTALSIVALAGAALLFTHRKK
ncbi:glycosyl hydrolase [Clostridium facile]|uniref:glycosyl hydrolase n=1 Tax=Clostridium facile TaxID=2763035 RepID=UPI0025702811|nr:glycosyl hydrolase [Clostridium facile]